MTVSRDAIEAMQDALLERCGYHQIAPHPQAHAFLAQPLSAVAEICGREAYAARGGNGGLPPMAYIGRGMSTSDFKNALAGTMRRLAVAAYDQSAGHRQICADLEVPNFQPVEFPTADVDLTLEQRGELAERTATRIVDVQGLTANLDTYSRRIFVSRDTVVNDDVALLGAAFAALGSAASRLEAKLVADLLEGNPTLGDGQPMFDTGNTVAQALAAGSLGDAMGLLRTQTTPAGNLANHRAAVLTVAAGLELSAQTILTQAGVDMPVVCLPWLPTGRWYLQASPKMAPVVGRLVLKGADLNGRPVTVTTARTQKDMDGVALAAVADLGVVALGRVGIVKGGA